jgi:hypothetical protein
MVPYTIGFWAGLFVNSPNGEKSHNLVTLGMSGQTYFVCKTEDFIDLIIIMPGERFLQFLASLL